MRKNYGFFAGSPSDGRFLSCQRSRTVRVSGSKQAFSPEKRRSISPLPTISPAGRWWSEGVSISATESQSESATSRSCVEKRMHLPSSRVSRRSSVAS